MIMNTIGFSPLLSEILVHPCLGTSLLASYSVELVFLGVFGHHTTLKSDGVFGRFRPSGPWRLPHLKFLLLLYTITITITN